MRLGVEPARQRYLPYLRRLNAGRTNRMTQHFGYDVDRRHLPVLLPGTAD